MLLGAEPYGIFVPGPSLPMPGLARGRLSGQVFTVHHGFDCASRPTGCGNPHLAASRAPAPASAPSVVALRQAGAACVGVTTGEEFSVGLTGANAWFGTPRNPAAPDRMPGGACAGAAVAVAAGLTDIALGTDAAGSVRVPASYCGAFGFRPSMNAVSSAGVYAAAPSLTAVGWMTGSASLLAEVGDVLLPFGRTGADGPLLRPREAWVNAQPAVAEALRPAVEGLERLRGRALDICVIPEGLDTLFNHFRIVYGEEIWTTLGSIMSEGAIPGMTAPAAAFGPAQGGLVAGSRCDDGGGIGPALARTLEAARLIEPEMAASSRAFRRALQGRLRALLAGGAILVVPTCPSVAPRLDAPLNVLELVQQASQGVTAIAELCGLPEVTLPVARVDDAPVGLSLIGGAGHDRALLALACDAADILGLPVG